MKKIHVVLNIVVFILAGFFYLGGTLESCDSGSLLSSVVINEYNADITLDANGDMTVVETWDMNYNEAMTVRFRDIEFKKYGEGYPLYRSATNTASFDETVAEIQVFKDGTDVTNQIDLGYSFNGDYDELGYPVSCDPYSSTCESLFANLGPVEGLEGQVTFRYTYKIIGAVTEYSDVSELNWKLFEYAEGNVKESTVTINFPNNSHDVTDMLAWGHGLSKGTVSIPNNHQVVLEMNHIKTTEYIEFRILTPTDLFPNVDSKNKVIDSRINKTIIMDYEADLVRETNLRITIAQVVLYASIGVVAVMAFVTAYVYKKYDKEYTASFTGDYYRELPSETTPAEMSYLYYMKKINDEDLTATLLDLIRRKYILLDYSGEELTSKDADFKLQLAEGMSLDELKPHERHLLTWFFEHIGDGKNVSTKKIESYGKTVVSNAQRFERDAIEFVRLAKQAGDKHDYFEKSSASGRKVAFSFILIPALMFLIALITAGMFTIDNTLAIVITALVSVSYLIYVSTIKRRTVQGNEEFVKWKAFRNFLINFGNMKDYPIPGIIVWEHYLVYATSLKCADTVMNQLKVRLPETDLDSEGATFMRTGYRSHGFYYGYAFGHFNRSISTARTNSRQTIATYNQSKAGGSGRGGGFGGGSSFGGGGGGGRSR